MKNMNVKKGDIWGGAMRSAGQVEFFVVCKVSECFVTLAKIGKKETMVGDGMLEVTPVVPASLNGLQGKRVKHFPSYCDERCALMGAMRVEKAPASYRVAAMPSVQWAV